ncbi:MAG: DNA-binding response regulator [Candidatus Cloacimonetes bacterium HGW-Cloacimonetes-3]|nr:MAG: DNA-binding response regulator [Candidatus Cloacimonetes bacterium HGW-Cloacimonetes-3]
MQQNANHDCILIVDDDEVLLETLVCVSKELSANIFTAGSKAEAMKVLKTQVIELMILDVVLPDGNGIEMLKQVRDIYPRLKVIIITGSKDIHNVVDALRYGANDYLLKPFDFTDFLTKISNVLSINKITEDIQRIYHTRNTLEQTLEDKYHPFLIGISPQIEKVVDHVVRVATIDTADVLITGESGVGKELVAKAIHQFSLRGKKVFNAVNCSSIPEPLFESQFFGHTRQAFTGAVSSQKGTFEESSGGTLFLDEISNLSLSLQAKFLRVLESRKVRPVGSNRSIDVDVRLLYASNVNLADMVQYGTFRSDLYHRINTFEINIPPLRERKEDIRPLVHHFCSYFADLMKIDLIQPEEHVYSYLEDYDYPGNVRELKNILRKAIILNDPDSDKLALSSFPILKPMRRTMPEMPAAVRGFQRLSVLETIEAQWIQYALLEYKHNITRAAKELGISRPALHRKIEKYKL